MSDSPSKPRQNAAVRATGKMTDKDVRDLVAQLKAKTLKISDDSGNTILEVIGRILIVQSYNGYRPFIPYDAADLDKHYRATIQGNIPADNDVRSQFVEVLSLLSVMTYVYTWEDRQDKKKAAGVLDKVTFWRLVSFMLAGSSIIGWWY